MEAEKEENVIKNAATTPGSSDNNQQSVNTELPPPQSIISTTENTTGLQQQNKEENMDESQEEEINNMSVDEDSVITEEDDTDKVSPKIDQQQNDTALLIDENVSITEANEASSDTKKDLITMEGHHDLPSTSSGSLLKEQEPDNSVYHLKWFEWKGQQTPIITQNENGPCPLLAIANVLILARKIELPTMQQIISGKQLMEYIGDCILSSAPEQDRDNEELILNYQQNMQDAIDIMHKLQTGIDVNVKFSGVSEFEFTRECIVFDLLKIALYHGWLVDPQDTPTMNAINALSYNQVVERMLTAKESVDDNTVSEGLTIEDFLSRSASQLTYHGLCELNDTVQEEELCVFFRNNHFSTLYKHKSELFILVTDQGFLTEPAVIWETLVNIEGDGQFVNSDFRTIQLEDNDLPPPLPTKMKHAKNAPPIVDDSSNLTQEYQDYLIALSLQQQGGNSPQPAPKHPAVGDPHSAQAQQQTRIDSDHALALQLQEDENRQAAMQQQQQQSNPSPPQQQQQQPVQQQQRTPQGNDNSRQTGHEQSRRDAHSNDCSIL